MAQHFITVLLTSGGMHGFRIANRLKKKDFLFDAVIFVYPESWRECEKFLKSNSNDKSVNYFFLLLFFLRSHLHRFSMEARHRHFSHRISFAGLLNSERLKSELQSLQPDFLILGGVGILSREVIDLVKYGVINSHPGLLPWVRGNGVVGNSILKNIAVGSTCHYINSKIDKGAIIRRKLLPLSGEEKDLQTVERMNDDLAAELMTEIIFDYIEKGEVPPSFEQQQSFKICKWLSEEERERCNKNIMERKALITYQGWKRYCEHDSDYLPDGEINVDLSTPNG